MRVLWYVCIVLLLSGTATAQDKRAYLCASAGSTGFASTNNAWRQTNFVTLRFTMVFEGKVARIKKSDTDEETYTCSNPWQSQPNLWQCIERFYFLVFDERLMRFTYSQTYGHVNRSDDQMVLSYGDCQRF